jgi:hypothetical protein
VVEEGLNYTAFGFISPVVGLFLLVFSLLGLRQATQRNAPKRLAIASIVLSIAIAVLPAVALLSGVTCDGPCYT